MCSEEVIQLDFSKNKRQAANNTVRHPVYLGRKYIINNTSSNIPSQDHGIVADYVITPQSGKTVPFNPYLTPLQCIIWDEQNSWTDSKVELRSLNSNDSYTHDACQFLCNQLTMRDMTISGPEIVEDTNGLKLILSPRFAFEYNTDTTLAKLGVITLVRSNRFINLHQSGQITLLDTGNSGSALYLKNKHDHTAVKLINTSQEKGENQAYIYTHEVSQNIFDTVEDKPIASFTVLEHYNTFFMQRECNDMENTIWIPAHAPISWGWSIRLERNYDNQWRINRRKLMFPNISNDGLQLPEWDTNTVECTY